MTSSSSPHISAQGSPTSYLPLLSLYARPLGAEPLVPVLLPVPVRRNKGPCWAILLTTGVVSNPRRTKQEYEREVNEIWNPAGIMYYDAVGGQFVEENPNHNERLEAYFGVPRPEGAKHFFYVVGRRDDPKWTPTDRRDQLRVRILAGLDVLLPFFADENRPWTGAANKAAEEVRDFFPLAAEPGLWPYYRAEGREFFAWLEKKAPPAQAPPPWATNPQ